MTNLFDLTPTHNSHRWYLPVREDVTVGPPGNKFLFGGVGLAASITALERTTGRQTIWATAQYLSYANPPAIVDIDVVTPRIGKHITQARAIGHVGDQEIFTVNAALGGRPDAIDAQWAQAPDAPPPDDCEEMPRFNAQSEDLHAKFERRVAKGRFGPNRAGGMSEDGQAVFWARPRAHTPMSSGLLAIIADFVPSGVGHALGRLAGLNSLDNTIRIRALADTDWMLCDIRIHGVRSGFAHGRMHIFTRDGYLLATASQSGILRVWDSKEKP